MLEVQLKLLVIWYSQVLKQNKLFIHYNIYSYTLK